MNNDYARYGISGEFFSVVPVAAREELEGGGQLVWTPRETVVIEGRIISETADIITTYLSSPGRKVKKLNYIPIKFLAIGTSK